MSRSRQILLHVIIIAVFIFLEIYMVILFGTKANLLDFIIFYALQIAFFYGTSAIFLPATNKIFKRKIWMIISVIIFVLSYATINYFIIVSLYKFHGVIIKGHEDQQLFLQAIFRQIYVFALAFAYWYSRKSIRLEREKREQDVAIAKQNEQNAKLELALLRAQMNPHLMVNALSSVQGILLEKAPETVRIIYSLMDIQASVLKMSDPVFENTLGNELKVANQVVELFSHLGKTNLNFSVSVNEIWKAAAFPTHVLITLIENVFKHADFSDKEIPPFILVEANEVRIHILVQNKIAPSLPTQEWERIGTSSVHQTLENTFPDRYRWKESNTDSFYELDIKIFR